MSGQLFGTDRVLLYNVDPWNRLGFGVAAFGPDNVGTVNQPLHGLADEIGKLQLFVMTHVDANRTAPPSRNTIERLGKMLNRVQKVLGTRQQKLNEIRLEPGHAAPAPMIWTIHPVPFFMAPYTQSGQPQSWAYVRNKWLAEYNQLVMFGLSNLYQHSDNNLALTVTEALATQVYQYFREIKLRMGSELLNIPLDELKVDGFEFTSSHYDAYDPSGVTINIEALDHPGNIWTLPTEDDLRPLLNGIPANLILPSLVQFPIGPIPGIPEGMSGSDYLAGAGQSGGGASGSGPAIAQPTI